MMMSDIIITCPKCGHEFAGIILASISSSCSIEKDDELFSNLRKCENCLCDVDIYKGNNGGYAFRFYVGPLSKRIKRWFERFLP